jgi:hypothetical protein
LTAPCPYVLVVHNCSCLVHGKHGFELQQSAVLGPLSLLITSQTWSTDHKLNKDQLGLHRLIPRRSAIPTE